MNLTQFMTYVFVDYKGYKEYVIAKDKELYYKFLYHAYFFYKHNILIHINNYTIINTTSFVDYIAKYFSQKQYKQLPSWLLTFTEIVNK